MNCPFCDYKSQGGDDFFDVEQHVVQNHPEWDTKLKSRSALRRSIFMGSTIAPRPRGGRP